jgi:hypothetical protein
VTTQGTERETPEGSGGQRPFPLRGRHAAPVGAALALASCEPRVLSTLKIMLIGKHIAPEFGAVLSPVKCLEPVQTISDGRKMDHTDICLANSAENQLASGARYS